MLNVPGLGDSPIREAALTTADYAKKILLAPNLQRGTNAQVFFDFSGEWRSESKFSEAEKLLPRFYGNATFFLLIFT